MANLVFAEGRFDDAHAHIERAKLHAINGNDTYNLARAMRLQAWFWRRQHRFEEAISEALRAFDGFEKLGAVDDVESVRKFLWEIACDAYVSGDVECARELVWEIVRETYGPDNVECIAELLWQGVRVAYELVYDGELLETVLLDVFVDSSCSDSATPPPTPIISYLLSYSLVCDLYLVICHLVSCITSVSNMLIS